MAQLDAELIWEDGVHFIGTSPSGHTIHLDGNKTAGASPMELILLGLGGCASYDVVTIMKKSRQDITDVRCQMHAHRADTIPAVFTDIHLHFVVTGSDIKESQLAKAIELSAEKYCSASRMLSSGGVNITHDYEIIEK
ncbi:OsmC family protein [Moraxella catarrhalis]|uniref:OsmC-like family protein n=1 Tax=Moraxella catarrhalis TaxID=480 RepID=A0A3A9LKY1_MORCA|nr:MULTISPECIES: OsmC family protein [Moraxella]ADG60542.1 OsmC-like protein [Moraxella catarrhalis BBH18]AIK01593.1 osmC-like family protein [Moraxella catarrhalis]ARB67179.1 OsmC family protein [Moraxella catarrhalis]ARE66471.1 osmotically inducible protein OsmC [Moraxella catarrhalis]AVL50595.1 OsmC family protein [Moraxella catarrhalis]